MRDEMRLVRKKLYKSGKALVTAGIFSVVGFGAFIQQASADNTQNDSITLVKDAGDVSHKTDTISVQTADNTTATDKTAVQATQDTATNTTATDKTAVKATQDTAANTTATDKTAVQATQDTAAQTTATDKTTAQATQDTAAKTTATDKTAVQATQDTATNTTATDKTAVKATQDTAANTTVTDKTAAQATQDTAAKTTATDKIAAAQATQDVAAQTTDKTASTTSDTAKNLKVIDGKTYFVDNNGQTKKNFATVIDGKVMYFGKDDGALVTTDKYQFSEGLSSENNTYTAHNAAYATTADNFEAIDGYLTADSWYRPKEILADGKNWTPSTDKDLRPILMSWWPDKTTQVNYLNYMKSLGISNQANDYKVTDNQDALNQAAQDVQANIEQKISQEGQTQWLKDDLATFVNSQPNWNFASESQTTGDDKDHLQGGALLYVNSDKTPDANSDYRLLNRTPTNQKGSPSYTIDPTQGGYDFLLANDVDNSNPVVQAEQLNWMYYLLNFGSITDNDSDANFDSIRVDAVDNVDADLLQIAADYFKAAYGVNKNDAIANQHVSILEDWSDNDAEYVKDHGDNQLSMDNKLRLSLKYSLTMPTVDQYGNKRSGLEPFLTNSLVDRTQDNTENTARPNYSFVRAHDSEVQTVIAEIIKQKIDPNADGLTPTMDQLKAAFEIYNADQLKTNKEFTQYNIPSTYATILTNKDTVPRVYYGDLYTDNGQYMANKSPYYDAIDTLLKSRMKYVSGGQSMNMQYMQGDASMASDSYRGILTSVRYGKGAMSAKDKGNKNTRTQGIAVIQSNNPDLKLSQTDRVVVNMGLAHRNQAYRPVLLTTQDGLATYQNDATVATNLIKYTNANGELIFDQSDIQGAANPQVSGYLAAWVPMGAKDSQDARSDSKTKSVNDGQTLHSNAALDSQVIYESFSNFQDFPTTESEYTNAVIAKNTDLYKSWGITNFEFAPQYRSSTEGSFLDSIIQNGYAFTDRYDMGFNTPTKYGTVDQLRTAIKALHTTGIKAMADWVPDQIYNLTGKQVVTAQRVNNSGIYDQTSVINKTLYAAQTVGGGAYQAQYGGAFLDEIKSRYPELFKINQISTGVPMNPNEKITEWSAKYFNGTNIQGRGAYYVLKDWATNEYFKVSASDNSTAFLPKQLLNEPTSTGFISNDKGMMYYSMSGYQAKDTFIQDENNNWYYFDQDGYMAYGFRKVEDNNYYFLPNGIELQDAFLEDSQGQTYYFNQQGKQSIDGYYMNKNKQWRYFDKAGVMAKGLTTITMDGQSYTQYFDADGIQIKGKAIKAADNQLRYFALDSGNMVMDRFEQIGDNVWAYFGTDGLAMTGNQTIKGQKLLFDENGQQIKGKAVADNNGVIALL
ncbi:KxYKxGKxW signal peptide domain-containing protein [Leuconostoc fallax]|nr:glycoside hydrolase family 70 protein [Leuconostoc fallax]MCO6183533.1 KxYKxGKxW signal peptide domain-containing protein [Leuconostoc fallax]